jgi:hypothetical protein
MPVDAIGRRTGSLLERSGQLWKLNAATSLVMVAAVLLIIAIADPLELAAGLPSGHWSADRPAERSPQADATLALLGSNGI